MAADYKHLNRLLEIYTLIQGGSGWTAKKLAEKFKTTTRTIFRDIDVLKSVGIPVNHDPDQKCYTIARDFYMRPVELTFQEALALVSLGRLSLKCPTSFSGVSKSPGKPTRLLITSHGWIERAMRKSFSASHSWADPPRSNQRPSILP